MSLSTPAPRFSLFFLFLLVALTAEGTLPLPVLAVYLASGTAAAAAYAADKRAAEQGRRRVAERTLHLLGLLGGWPGAALAQWAFRHKTRKRRFVLVFRVTALVNCGALALFVAFG
ncbi:hypothetical protein GEOBRER4_n1289 [Citrifermentans bremense]|uniref:DUF1294 domain-containing protein n=1 Tax=Citrifermentans bremense TaxID=60035 RepID=A0A7R7FT89_9BACT|nr:hypothetical protein GEOBRER4_n1289 [Citrifermentans bremense]